MREDIAIVQFPGSNTERETFMACRRSGMNPVEFLWNEPHERAQLFKDRAKIGAHLGGNWKARKASMRDSVNFLLENIK